MEKWTIKSLKENLSDLQRLCEVYLTSKSQKCALSEARWHEHVEIETLGSSFSQLNKAIIIFILNQGRQDYDKVAIRTQLFRVWKRYFFKHWTNFLGRKAKSALSNSGSMWSIIQVVTKYVAFWSQEELLHFLVFG